MTTINLSREDAIARLEDQLPVIKVFDARQLKRHRDEEREYLTKFRESCKRAAKWDYETAKRNHFTLPDVGRRGAPSCPISMEARLERALRALRASSQKRYTFHPDSEVHKLITFDPNATPMEAC